MVAPHRTGRMTYCSCK